MIDKKYQPMDKKNAYATLWEAISFLNLCGIKPILAFGTLLGIYRDKDLINNDWDIDLHILAEDVPKFDEDFARKKGFEHVRIKQDLPKWKNQSGESQELLVRTISFIKNNIRVDVDPVYLASNGVDGVVLKGRKREKFVAKFRFDWFADPILIKDKWFGTYFAPRDTEEYLRLNYDHWQIPAHGHRDWKSRECRCEYYEI